MELTESAVWLAAAVAARLRDARVDLTTRWLERISERVSIDPNRVFPSEALLDHIPVLLVGIADALEDPARVLAADSLVVSKAMELGALRHDQGFTEYEILKEFEILGSILFVFLREVSSDLGGDATDWTACAQRLFQCVTALQEATATKYLQLMSAQVTEREDRLRAFDRALTHELRNRIGAVLGAAQLLEGLDLSEPERRNLAAVVARNAQGMRMVLENLLELARTANETRQQRHIRLAAAAAEAARQLRDMAEADNVELRIADDLPDVEVNAAAIELALVNFMSNAIKYHNPNDTTRWVEVGAEISDTGELHVIVRDNGRGVPPAARPRLFERFYRVHAEQAPHIEGTGLGLHIVRETVHALGGRVWADFPDQGGAQFAFAIPARRSTDLTADTNGLASDA
jgi:signal transduction histidine kinase